MLVCICKNVREDLIRELIEQGADIRKIRATCAAGSDCGSCLQDIMEIIERTRAKSDEANSCELKIGQVQTGSS